MCIRDSTPPLQVSISTSNFPSSTFTLNSIHGTEWSSLVTHIRTRITVEQLDLRTLVVGGIDAEPAWNLSEYTLDWFDGYLAADSEPDLTPFVPNTLYFFGTAGGCASTSDIEETPFTEVASNIDCSDVDKEWYLDDVLSMTARSGIRVVPQIYTERTARQWQQIAYHADRLQMRQPYYSGVLTQNAAYLGCVANPEDSPNCDSRLANTPNNGWSYFVDEIGSTTETVDLLANLIYSSDMFWQRYEDFYDEITYPAEE